MTKTGQTQTMSTNMTIQILSTTSFLLVQYENIKCLKDFYRNMTERLKITNWKFITLKVCNKLSNKNIWNIK